MVTNKITTFVSIDNAENMQICSIIAKQNCTKPFVGGLCLLCYYVRSCRCVDTIFIKQDLNLYIVL